MAIAAAVLVDTTNAPGAAPPRFLPPILPVALFGSILGILGLGNDWRAAARLWTLPAIIGDSLLSIGTAVWVVLVACYLAKWIWHRDAAEAEVRHPIACCFIGLVPVSTTLVGISVMRHWQPVGRATVLAGMAGTLAFGVWRQGGLWQGGRRLEGITPVLYLPTVAGGFVSALAAATLGWHDVGLACFGAALLSWLAIESVVLQRLLLAEPLPPALRATLGIQLAPPVVGLAAYLNLMPGAPGPFAYALLGYGTLQLLILLRLTSWIRQQPFGLPYWAFSFGVTALALDAEIIAERAGGTVAMRFAAGVLCIATLAVAVMGLGSLVLLWKHLRRP